MTPAEREARIAELRRRRDRSLKQPQEGVRGTSEIGQLTLAQREEFLKLRRQLRELPEAERQAKLREFFSKLGTNTADGAKSPADRAQQFRLMRERMEARIKLLEGKLADGSISETEKRQLERMQRFRRDRPD